MKNIYKVIGSLSTVAIPLATLVSCGDPEATNEEKAKADLKIINGKLDNQQLTTLLTGYRDRQKALFDNLKTQYDTNEIIASKGLNKIATGITSNISGVDFADKKISFKLQTEYTQEDVKYTIIQEATKAPIEVKKVDGKYLLGINIKTTQYNSRIHASADPTSMRVRNNFVSIRDIFGEWDDGLQGINKDQDDNIVRGITLFHTNDTHGRMETDGYKYNKYIGMSGIAAYVKKFKPDLLLSGGDFMQGTGISNYDHGQRAMQIATLIGYDAIAAGNHEFDWGYKTLIGRAKSTAIYSDNSFYNKTKNYAGVNAAKGPLASPYDVSANTNEHVIPGIRTKIIKGNLSVGIISLTTPDVATKVNPANVDDVQVELLSKYTQKEIDNLKNAGVQLIVITGHMGSEAASVETTEKLLKKIQGVDLVVDGHSHQLYDVGKTFKDKSGKDIPVAQTGAYTRNIGVMKFDYDKTNKKIVNFHNEYIDYDKYSALNLEKISEVDNIIASAKTKYDAYAGQDAFVLQHPLSDSIIINGTPTRTVRKFEASSGNFFADSLLWKTLNTYPQDKTSTGNNTALNITNTIGFVNGGGVRASVAGDSQKNNMTTKKDWINMSPFNNSLSTIRVTGKQLWDMFMHSAKSWNDGPFAQVSKNVEVKYDVYKGKKDADGNETTASNIVTGIKINGQAVPNDATKTYYVTGNDFLRNGGDGYKDIWKLPEEVYSGGTLSDILIAYGTYLGTSQADFTWADYSTSEIKPKFANRIIVTGKDQEATGFINGFN